MLLACGFNFIDYPFDPPLRGWNQEVIMVTIIKIVGVLFCGFVLYLGLSHAAQAGNADSAAYELNADQSDRNQGGQMSGKREAGPSPAAKMIKGDVLRVEGENVFIKGKDGKEVRVYVDATTQMGTNNEIKRGQPIEVQVNDQHHALSIVSGPAVTDRRNAKE